MNKTSMLLLSILFAATLTISPALLSTSTFGQDAGPKMPANSVTTQSRVTDGAVQAPDIAIGAVVNEKIRDGHVSTDKLAEQAVSNSNSRILQ